MKGRVFIVEDDLDLMELYCLLLDANQMEVWGTARTGEDALKQYLSASAPPDAVLLDHRLPGCTGLEVARQILRHHPKAEIVLVTADESAIKAARNMGIPRAKRKPISNASLLKQLKGALAQARAHRKAAS